MDLSTLPITGQAEIPEEYLDMMGHMNVAWYTHLFSNATGGFFSCIEMDAEYMRSNNVGSFALETHIRYLAEVRMEESVTLRTRALGRMEKRLHFIHFLVKDRGDVLAATGEFVGAHIDMSIRRMSPLTDFVMTRFDEFVEEHNQLNWPAPVCGAMNP